MDDIIQTISVIISITGVIILTLLIVMITFVDHSTKKEECEDLSIQGYNLKNVGFWEYATKGYPCLIEINGSYINPKNLVGK